MLDNDLETGRLSPQLSGWHSSFRGTPGLDFLKSAGVTDHATARPIVDEAEKQEYLAQDDLVIRVPRRKVEQLMKLWIEVFQDFSRTKPEDPESSKSAIHPEVQRPRPSNSNGLHDPTSPLRVELCTDQTSWKHMVGVMPEEEIEVETKRRRLVRENWRPDEKGAYLEDCWKHLWVFQWSYPDEKRKELQLALVDALNAQSGIMIVELYMRRDFRSIAPWISLIGLRLNQIYRRFYTTVSAPGITPATQIEVLIECLWCCNSYVPRVDVSQDRQGPTIGDVLSLCYRRRILCQPSVANELWETILREHFRLVRTALYLLNTLYKHHPPRFDRLGSLDRTWNLLLSNAEASMRETPSYSDFERGKDTFFRLDDFNLNDLQNLGHLKVQWTSYWDEHLQLETSSNSNILKIYWFQPSLAQYLVHSRLCTTIEYGERQRREKEICETWSILFTSNCTEKKARQCYEKLKAPKWLSLLAQTELDIWGSEQAIHEFSEIGPDLSSFTSKSSSSKYCFETQDHLMRRWSETGKVLHERISFSQFPIYGDRLRELRAYMDTQQPKGLRALWRDRRNSNTYYTFWFVAIFGSLSVFLATCALAVSIVQTWATFRTL